MATFKGNNGIVKIGANALGEVKEFSVSEVSETVEDTEMGDSWRSHLAGLKSWSGSATCHWDDTDTAQLALLVGASVTCNFEPEGSTTGNYLLTGTATVTEVGTSNTIDGTVERSFSFVGNGALTVSTTS
jgi:predicted secreted protein